MASGRERARYWMRLGPPTVVLIASLGCADRQADRFERIRTNVVAHLRRGELDAAQSLSEQGLELTRSMPDSTDTWSFRLLRAESLILQRKPDDTLRDLTQALPAGKDFDWLRAKQKYLQARLATVQGHLQEALDTVDEARGISPPRDVRFDLEVLGGQIRLRAGRQPEAESMLRAVIKEATAVGDRYHEACALNDLGMGSFVRNRFDEALASFEQVLTLPSIREYTIYAQSVANAGSCYAELGEFDRAAALQQQAVQLLERRGLRSESGQAIGELGRTALSQNRVDEALSRMRKAFEVASELRADDNAALWAGNLAEVYIQLGQWDEAARFNDEATRIRQARGTGRLIYNTRNAAQIAEGRGQKQAAKQLYQDTLVASVDEPTVGWEAEAGLARLAMAEGDSKHATAHFETALSAIEKTRSGLIKTDYRLSYLNRLIAFYREYVDALIAQGRTDRAVEIADSSRGRVLAERQRTASPTRVNVATLQNIARHSGKVLLFYWLQPQTSRLWVITPKDTHLVALAPGDQIEALVREYQKMIGSALADPLAAGNTPGDQLYATLVAPAARWIAPGASLIIVPDGALHGLNFETLPVAEPHRHYWIEDVEIQIAPSLGLLAAEGADTPPRPPASSVSLASTRSPQSLQRKSSSLLLIGSPTATDPKYPALSYASAEMAKVAAHFGTSRVVSFEGPRASPAAYRNAPPDRFSMIHFTAHAAANVESPLDSAVILSPEGGTYKLYARDVADLPLHAELVTVSACRGAGERTYSGEGLIGFAWAFLRAGAKRVIAGLWDVDDQSTARLMETLYARIADGDSPSRGLRAAKLAMLQGGGSFGRPYYWGPFEIFTVAP